jgi:hypothetical protein
LNFCIEIFSALAPSNCFLVAFALRAVSSSSKTTTTACECTTKRISYSIHTRFILVPSSCYFIYITTVYANGCTQTLLFILLLFPSFSYFLPRPERAKIHTYTDRFFPKKHLSFMIFCTTNLYRLVSKILKINKTNAFGLSQFALFKNRVNCLS